MKTGVFPLSFLVSISVLCSARAEWLDMQAGIGPVFGSSFNSQEKDGFGASGYLGLGLTETLSLSASGGYVDHCIGSGSGYSLAHASAGISYNIDVLVVIPWASLQLGWLLRDPENELAVSGLGISFALGFDYLWTDMLSLGFAAEYHGMLSEWEVFPAYVAFTGRLGLRLSN